eukprot:8701237-Pyramimonas_sp.AAC.1
MDPAEARAASGARIREALSGPPAVSTNPKAAVSSGPSASSVAPVRRSTPTIGTQATDAWDEPDWS